MRRMWLGQRRMAEPHLRVERRGGVLVLTMNRPHRKNAMTGEMLARMADALGELRDDDDLRVAVLTGADGNFCSGSDLKEMYGGRPDDEWKQRHMEDQNLAWRGLLRHDVPPKPIIAAVEGYAVAGGTELLQGTDIRVAGEGAQFGIAEAQRGLFPLGGSTVRLRRQIPYTFAAEMLLLGRRITAAEALRFGLIGHVVPDGTALAKALELAAVVEANAPLSVKAIKQSLIETEGHPEAEALATELRIGMPIFPTADARAGPRAFAEKRPPRFKGR